LIERACMRCWRGVGARRHMRVLRRKVRERQVLAVRGR
jgi:hypothetical protein